MPSDRVKFIPPGIDYGITKPVDEKALRREYNLGEGPLFVYSGNLDGYQRIDLLIKALPEVFRNYPDSKLVVLTGSSTEDLLLQAREHAVSSYIRVIERPDFDLVKAILRICVLAVNPRISWSGYPIKLLNYLAAGLPVVAFEGAAPPVKHGHNGYLAEPDDVFNYGRFILELLMNPAVADRMGENAQSYVLNCHNWDEIVKEIEIIYSDLLNLEIKESGYHSESTQESLVA
jgi:glycosyltransferase involved in cell wall biosynthesis